MAPSAKETVETGNSSHESAVLQSNLQQKSAGDHLRSDAVSLEVAVKIHGTRVAQAVRGGTPQTEPFEEQTTTMIVFPQGGVLRMATSVSAGQMLVVTNSKSKQDAICRVLKVRSFPNMPAYVEVEFTHAQPGYWGVYFPSEGAASKPVAAVPPAVSQPDMKQGSGPDISWTPVPSTPAPKPAETTTYSKEVKPVSRTTPVPPSPKPVSTFVSIGSQEEVQPAASSTSATKAARTPYIEKASHATAITQNLVVPFAETPAAPATTPSLQELCGDEDAISSVLALVESEAKQSAADSKAADGDPVFGRFGNALGVETERAITGREDFGARLDVGIAGASQTAEARPNWILIAACIAVLFVAVGGGVLYFRSKPANNDAAPTTAPAQQTAAPESAEPSAMRPLDSQPVQSAQPFDSNATAAARVNPAPATSFTPSPNAHSAPSSKSIKVPSEPSAAVEKPVAPKVSPRMLASTLKAHPVSSQRAVAQDEAPSVDSASNAENQPGDLLGIASIAAPPPPGGAPVSGTVKEPKLISSVLPVYPAVAKQAHIQGDVVVDTQIDKNGNVVHMNVTSGPMMLRQAALDAVRRWKYEPSTLDGRAVPVEMFVTVKFRL